ncbi:hypothetical protein WJ438_33695 [Streptomyces sp. GD-15H]
MTITHGTATHSESMSIAGMGGWADRESCTFVTWSACIDAAVSAGWS